MKKILYQKLHIVRKSRKAWLLSDSAEAEETEWFPVQFCEFTQLGNNLVDVRVPIWFSERIIFYGEETDD